jgi:hypothetical protein
MNPKKAKTAAKHTKGQDYWAGIHCCKIVLVPLLQGDGVWIPGASLPASGGALGDQGPRMTTSFFVDKH